jgi:hypothetical protein
MRLSLRSAVVPLLIALPLAVALGETSLGEPRSDCTFDPHAFRSPREVFRAASMRAEAVAPEAVTIGRRRAVMPPKLSFQAKNFVDDEIFGKMVRDGIVWTSKSPDEEFLRRVTLDLTGQIPDAETVKAFLADTSAGKRDKLVDALLASDAFNDRWTMWYGDLVQNVQFSANSTEYYQGRNAFYQFIRDSFAAKKPYDKLVRETLSQSGPSFSAGPVNYWVRQIQSNGPIQDTYDNLSAASGQMFLGMPLQCLSCHNGIGHLELVNSGMARRTRYDFWKNASFFSQVTLTTVRDAATNSREVTVIDNNTGEYRLNTTSGNKTPRVAPQGQPAIVVPGFILSGDGPTSGEPRRTAYGRILTAHPQFARATVNYLWKEIFGAGIVEPADSFDLARQDPATLADGATLQPTHPQLLTKLADSFTASGYDIRALLRTLVTSEAYQLSSRYTAGTWNEAWAPYYARHYPRRLLAEEVLDEIFKATGVGAQIAVTGMTTGTPRAMMLPDTSEGGGYRKLLNDFGRGNRDDDPRSNDGSIVQALALMNDPIVVSRIRSTAGGSTVSKLKTSDPATIAETLYLTTLSRYPTAAEKQAAIDYVKSGDAVKKTEDLQFALLNKLEFLFN